MNHHISKEAIVPIEVSGQRFDQVAASLFPEYSRARLQEWIKTGEMILSGRKVKPKAKVVGGERVSLTAVLEKADVWLAQEMPLSIVFEDEHILVLNKSANMVVHPAPGNYEGTLLNGLLHYLPDLGHLPRAGIVHRLDKDTTGLMVVAKTLIAQNSLVSQLQARSVSRRYMALVHGKCPSEGLVNQPIGRDPKNRKKMAVHDHSSSTAKEAITHFSVLERVGLMSLLRLKLETGRTHQIRVHLASMGCPIIGDPLYGKKIPNKTADALVDAECLKAFSRQALHAESLALIHPHSHIECSWSAPLPDDMKAVITAAGFTYE